MVMVCWGDNPFKLLKWCLEGFVCDFPGRILDLGGGLMGEGQGRRGVESARRLDGRDR